MLRRRWRAGRNGHHARHRPPPDARRPILSAGSNRGHRIAPKDLDHSAFDTQNSNDGGGFSSTFTNTLLQIPLLQCHENVPRTRDAVDRHRHRRLVACCNSRRNYAVHLV